MLSTFATCPGLFQPAIAQDGVLVRLRIPGGLLTIAQCEAIAQLADEAGSGQIQITNRANLQMRGLQAGIDPEVMCRLQTLGLASPLAQVDALRNIMGSPTAGIDRQQWLDTRPLVAAWNQRLISRSDFAVLSPKFSVCFDGGEAVSVRDRPNDISLVAIQTADGVRFRLHLSLGDRGNAPSDVGILVKSEATLQILTALTEVYRDYTIATPPSNKQRKPRLRELLQDWGVDVFLQAVASRLPFTLQRSDIIHHGSLPDSYHHIGVHAQKQPDTFYIGIGLPLGRLPIHQLRELVALAANYSGVLRLTPWQTVLLSDIPSTHIAAVQQKIEQMGLHWMATHPLSAIVACSGTTGCHASATNTQQHALALATHLEQYIKLDRPINIHFSGCERSCAQHHPSDITLLGIKAKTYRIYIGNVNSKFGRELCHDYLFAQVPDLIEHMLRTYQRHRSQPDETFKEFVNRYELADLQQLFSINQPLTQNQENALCQ